MKKVWTDERCSFILDRRDMDRHELYPLFMSQFPDCGVTWNAFSTQLNKLGIYTGKHYRSGRPMYSEQMKKGYVRIKTPRGWMQKQKWVYCEAHPEYYDITGMTYMFLDGDNFNFALENIMPVPKKLVGLINMNGEFKGNPDGMLIAIRLAELKVKQFDIMEKTGDAVNTGYNRVDRLKRNAMARERRKRYLLENPDKRREQERRWAKNTKKNRTEEQKEHYRKYQREWQMAKRRSKG